MMITYYEGRKKYWGNGMLDQLKSKNIADILVFLFTNGVATKSDLVRGTTLGNSTISDTINDLTNLKLVRSVGKEDSVGGRRSTLYEINKNYGRFVGVAFCGNDIKFVTTDCHNNINKSWEVKTNGKFSAISVLLGELRRIMKTEKNVLGIGIGLHGEIDYKSQIVINCGSPHWQHVHLKEIVERELLTFTVIDHYVNGASMFEKYLGAAKGIDNFIYYTELAPQKMAIFLDGHVCRGKKNMAGKIIDFKDGLLSGLSNLRQELDVEKVIIAASDGLRCDDAALNSEDTMLLKANKYDLARGMAISAEIKWFSRALKR